MKPLRILLSVHTVAAWGGLQDWAVGMVKGLVANGAEVHMVANNQRIVEECQGFARHSFLIDWGSWQNSVKEILATCEFDVVFTQPFAARELALELRRRTGVPIVYMSHGNNSDFAYGWRHEIAKFLVASSSLIPMLRDFCGVTDTPIEVLPNGVPDSLFDIPTVGYQARIDQGSYDFVLAARLMPDKLSQVDGLIAVASSLLRSGRIPKATVHLMGGGPSKEEFLARLGAFVREDPRAELHYHGWVSQTQVVDQLRSAVFSVAGGVTGAQSMAVGTPCLGAGIRGICGVSTPANMDRVLGSNFGDHSARLHMTPAEIERDCQWILEPENFKAFQECYVPLMRHERTHSAIAALALRQISDAVSP
ncbi:MAG: glycosyltransferase family 4 protein [Propionibacteriaceae bacterium]|nr:glycosyltransferase family 4 protein [Propionibacteriaceae bacterium]